MSETDFMNPENQPVLTETNKGTVMTDFESYERVIEGLKQSADASLHLAHYHHADQWGHFAGMFDTIRGVVVKLSGSGRVNDARPSILTPMHIVMPEYQAYQRVVEGLKQAVGGSRQLGVYHRKDPKWLAVSGALMALRDKAIILARMRSLRSQFAPVSKAAQ